MSKFYSLFSSSKGNASFVGSPAGGVLVDAGVSCRRLLQSLAAHDIPEKAVQAVCITHTHTDHIAGLRVFLGKHPIPVYGTAETLAQLRFSDKFPQDADLREILPTETIHTDSVAVTAFPTMHDAPGSCGYRFELPDGCSYQDVLALMRVLIRKRKIGRRVRLLSRIFLISAGCILLWISCSQWNRVREGQVLLLAAMIVGILGVAAGVFVYSAHVAAWLSWRMQAKDKGRTCICLDDSVLTEESKKGTEIRPYSAFQEAYLYKKYWILFQNNYHAKILPQTAMTTGNPEDFPAFWVEKTGMPIKTIR